MLSTLPWSHKIDDFVIFHNKGTENSNSRREIVEFGSTPLISRGNKTWIHGMHFNTVGNDFQAANVLQGIGAHFLARLDDLDRQWWGEHCLPFAVRVPILIVLARTYLLWTWLVICLGFFGHGFTIALIVPMVLDKATLLAYGCYGYLKRSIKAIRFMSTRQTIVAAIDRFTEKFASHVTFSSTMTFGYNMADMTGRRRRDLSYSRPGSVTLPEGKTQSLSDETEVGRSFSSRDSADLSGTIQDPDEPPPIRLQVFAGGLGGGGGPMLPGTGDGEIDLSDIGRPAQGTGKPSPKPVEADRDLNFKIPPPVKPKRQAVDISQFKNPDGSYDMARIQAVVSTRVQTGVQESRAERRAKRARGPTVPVPAMKPLDTTQATTLLGRAEEVYPSQVGRSGGRGGQQRKPRGNLKLSPIAERSSMGSKNTENFESKKKTVLPGGEESDNGKQPTVEEDKSAALEPIADDSGSLYGASPPRRPVQNPLPHDPNTSPAQSEKYRRWAAESADSPTVDEKFKEWVDRGRSSESKTAAQELEGWAQNDLYDAREKHLAWLFEQRGAASRQLKIETEKSRILKLRKVIINCTLGIKEAIRLEDKRQNRNASRKNVELETNVLVKTRFQELLQELDREVELEEKVEQVRLQKHMRHCSIWRKVFDMTPTERAALNIPVGYHFAAPAQHPTPMVLRESFAEQLLRDKWEKEDPSEELEDLFDHIGGFSDSEERDTYWEAFQDIRRPILLQRNKELTNLWKEQANQLKAERQDAWLKSEAEAEEKLLKLRQLDKRNKEEEEAKKRQFVDALAATVAKKKAEDAEVDKTIEDIEGVRDAPNAPPVAGQRKRMGFSGLVAGLKAKRDVLPEPSTQGEEASGRKGLPSVRTAPKVAGDSGAAETAVAVDVSLAPKDSAETDTRTTSSEEEENISLSEPRPGSPFRADNSLSSIQEQRSSLSFETDREVADFLEYMAMVRRNEEVVRTGEGELIDSELMREKEKRVMILVPIDPAEEVEKQKRIQAAEKRLKKIIARATMPKEELKALEEKEHQQRKRAKEKKKEEERKRKEIDKENRAEKERKEREAREMAVRDQINREREEKAKVDQIARDKIAKDLKDKEDKKKPDVPVDFAGDILTKIKNDLLAKAGGVGLSKPAGEVDSKQDNKVLDDYMKEIMRKFEEELAQKDNAGKGKDKPEKNTAKDKDKPAEKPPAETDSVKKARIEKGYAEQKDLEAARARDKEALARRKKEAEAEAAKNKPGVDYAARDEAERLAREERERETRERDRLAQERADELKNRPALTAEQKAEAEAKRAKLQKIAQEEEEEKKKRAKIAEDQRKRKDKIIQDENDERERKERERVEKEAQEALRRKKLSDERRAKEPKDKEEIERLRVQEERRKLAADLREKKRKEGEENERLKKAEADRLADEEIERLQKELERNELLQKENEEKKRLEQEKKDEDDRLLDEQVNRQWDKLQLEKAAQQKEKDRIERDERDQEERERNERLKKLEEDRLARDRIAKKQKEKEEAEKSVRVENLQSEVQNPDLRKERKEREKKEKDKKEKEAAAAAATLANRAQGGGLFQNITGRINFPDLSWLNFRGPAHLQERAGNVASDAPSPSIRAPISADYELAPVDIAWMHAYAAESAARRKISVNLTIFSSVKQHLSGAAPPHYLVCHDIPMLWNVSQLKRHLSAIVQKAKTGEKKAVRLRIERRWLKNGSKTLVEEGFRDWESVVVVMVEAGENVREGDWKECVREADGMAGWIEGWPGKGALRMPADRKAWLAEAFEGVFEAPVMGK
ncbi:hypothetical protein BOTNAR_0142g00110 [Botryotinia narcissicola]|uniref:Uncharacterized protein n=1 Tax=Botryotinia narcissicola TaxID=278944 RepID=A0A4Z1IN34_9HELO|nr:hypothetical protein BOTNAR_0142g00110 [Botryotinia narcissicola]